MVRYILLTTLCLMLGCSGRKVRMAQPEDPKGRYQNQIAAAQALLEQKVDWANRVEWEVLKTAAGWQVVAWRIEHPDRKGPERYLPWGYSEIDLDGSGTPISYKPKG